MVELTPEERRALKELVAVRRDGGSAEELIHRRLYEELSHFEDREFGVRVHVPHEGFSEQHQVYVGLLEKGIIEGGGPGKYTGYRFGGLTSLGRCYFEMEADARRRERSRIWSDRRFQVALSIGTLVLSAAISTCIGLYMNQPSDEAPRDRHPQEVAEDGPQDSGYEQGGGADPVEEPEVPVD